MTVTCTNAATITFPKATGGTNTITYFGVGTSSSGAGKLIVRKALSSSIAVSNNIQPQFSAGDLDIAITGDVSDAWVLAQLNHYFLNSSITLVGDATGLPAAATVGSLYVSLHTADPGVGGDQSTNEATYTSYARVAVARTTGGWTIA